MIIESLLEDNKDETTIKWETMYGLFENAIYGGRIDNDFDTRVLRAYLEQYFNVDVLEGNKKLPIGMAIPKSKSIKDYIVFINKLSEVD